MSNLLSRYFGRHKRLHSEDPVARARAAHELGWSGDHKAIDPLTSLLSDEDARVRSEAAWALGQLRAKRSRDAIIQALADPDHAVRKRLREALHRISPNWKTCEAARASQGTILHILRTSPHSRERKWATKVLCTIADSNIARELAAELLLEESSLHEQVLEILARMDCSEAVVAVPALLESFGEADGVRRRRIAKALGSIGHRSAMPCLLEILDSPDPGLSSTAALALGRLGERSAIEPLKARLVAPGEPDAVWRALGELGYEPAMSLSALLARLNESNPRIVRDMAMGRSVDFEKIPRFAERLRPLVGTPSFEAARVVVPGLSRDEVLQLVDVFLRDEASDDEILELLAEAKPPNRAIELTAEALTMAVRWDGEERWWDPKPGDEATKSLCETRHPVTDRLLVLIARSSDSLMIHRSRKARAELEQRHALGISDWGGRPPTDRAASSQGGDAPDQPSAESSPHGLEGFLDE